MKKLGLIGSEKFRYSEIRMNGNKIFQDVLFYSPKCLPINLWDVYPIKFIFNSLLTALGDSFVAVDKMYFYVKQKIQ